MNDTQKEILRMLADKVITVDEAERLLKAVNDGEKRKEEGRPHFGRHHHPMSGIFESIGETFADIGPMVKQSIEDVMTGVIGDDLGDVDEEELAQVELLDGTCTIPSGAQLILIHDWKAGCAKQNLRLHGVPGEVCRLSEEGAKHVRVRQNSTHVVMQWSDGPLAIDVPETVSAVKVNVKGGDIHAQRLGCELNLKTMGGNLEILDLSKPFHAKTMGGNITLSLLNDWQGQGRAHTMGGNIELTVPSDGAAFKVKASTMGGTVKFDQEMRPLESKQSFPGKNKVKIQVGEGETDSLIALKTMGGDIEVRRTQHEE